MLRYAVGSCSSLTGHIQRIRQLALSPNRRTLASLCSDQSIKLWHVCSRRELLTLTTGAGGEMIVQIHENG